MSKVRRATRLVSCVLLLQQATAYAQSTVVICTEANKDTEECKAYSNFLRYIVNGYPEDRNYTGVYKTYYGKGAVRSEVNYVNGQRVGLMKEFFNDGTLLAESKWKDDQLDGVMKTYHGNGQISGEYFYVSGQLQGSAKTYDDKGQLLTERPHENEQVVEERNRRDR